MQQVNVANDNHKFTPPQTKQKAKPFHKMCPYFLFLTAVVVAAPIGTTLRRACVHIIINSRIFINRNDQFIHYTDRKIMAIA